MNLIRAEISRLASRRFVQLMLVLLIGAFGVTVATTVAGSHQPTAVEIADAKNRAELDHAEALRRRADCLAAQGPDVPEHVRAQYPRRCPEVDPRQFTPERYLFNVFVFEREIRGLLYFLAAFLALFGFLVGASYIGSDLNSGGMTNLLLWRPQRLTVLGTKLGTLLGGVLAVAVVASTLYLAAFWLVAQTTGFLGNLDAEFWQGPGLTWVRGLALALGATAVGFAIATLGRHTAAALGAVAAYGIVWEIGARIVMDVVDAPRPDQWMLSTYLFAWLTGELELYDFNGCRFGSGLGFCTGSYTLTWIHALLVLGALGSALVVAAFASFHHRDIA